MKFRYKSPRLINRPTISARSTWIDENLWREEIWKRLPVKTLCRFRCVCKSWNSTISSFFMVNLHHSFNISSSTIPAKLKPYLLVDEFAYPTHGSYVLCRPQQTLKHKLHFPFQSADDVLVKCFDFVDVIHGVLCISYSVKSSFDSTILWNPSIHKYVSLPSLNFPSNLDSHFNDPDEDALRKIALFGCHAIGFGYDSSKNDFKVVRIWIPTEYINSRFPLQPTYEIYSYKKGLCSVGIAANLHQCPFLSSTRISRSSCFVSGTLHWILVNRNVLMFDCESENFKTMELPEEIFLPEGEESWTSREEEILEYGGMLAVAVKLFLGVGIGFERRIDLWVMEEHGVADSWKKLYSIRSGFNNVDVYQPSFVKLSPSGPRQWKKTHCINEKYILILSGHVFEESLILMDDAKARSYAKEEIVYI